MGHTNLIHHFGSAAGLQKALMAEMTRELTVALEQAVHRFKSEKANADDLISLVFEAFDKGGAGRLAAWISLSGEADKLEAIGEVVRDYLTEIPRLVTQNDQFSVLAHVDYPVRFWPEQQAGPFDPAAFEEEFRYALRSTAAAGKALEVNTRIPLHSTVLTWWHEEGGDAITFGSDAHEPSAVAHGFREAVHLAEAHGYRPAKTPHDFWTRAN